MCKESVTKKYSYKIGHMKGTCTYNFVHTTIWKCVTYSKSKSQSILFIKTTRNFESKITSVPMEANLEFRHLIVLKLKPASKDVLLNKSKGVQSEQLFE